MTRLLLEVDGTRYDGFTSITVSRSIENVASSFSFEATASSNISFPITTGQKARVVIGDIPVVNGYVENINVNYDSGSHSITIEGRDKTCDLVDSTLGGKNDFIAPIGLIDVVQNVLNRIGINGIQVKSEAGALSPFKKGELIAGAVDKNAFEFIEEYCRKRQVLCTTDGDGNILLTKASQLNLNTQLISQAGQNTNSNIIRASVNYNVSQRYNRYLVRSQGNPSVDGGVGTDNETIVSQKGEAFDREIRSGRLLGIIAESSSGGQTAQQRAQWQANINKARSFTYNVTVQGFNITPSSSAVWIPNRLVDVLDEFANINDTLLIKEVAYRFGLDGSFTELTLVNPLSYTLEQQEKGLQKKIK